MRVSEACARGTEVMSSPVLAAPNSEAKDADADADDCPPWLSNQLTTVVLLPAESKVISPVPLLTADIFHTPLTLANSSVVGLLLVNPAILILSPTL